MSLIRCCLRTLNGRNITLLLDLQVTLDGVNIQQLPLGWLRRQIGLVSQEPCLFQTSIYNNIVYGCPTATQEQVYAAARAANAHDFISKLPNG
jgi:ATP-binding cassette, subfamily B (MDR/TAP), member 1